MIGRRDVIFEGIAERRWLALAALIAISLVSIVDRQVFVLLAEPVRHAFALSDLELGVLQGAGLSAFAAIVSIPLGWLVDRADRRLVLFCCMLVWGAAVVACGLVSTFPALFLASALVGAGEAGVIPVAYALIPALFAGRDRQLANSLFTVAGRFGVGLALALCGALITLADALSPYLGDLAPWRTTFILAGLGGTLLSVAIYVIPASVARAAPVRTDSHGIDRRPLFARYAKAYVGFYGAMAFAMFGLTALTTWLSVVLIRRFGFSAAATGSAFGLVTMLATACGLVGSVALIRSADSVRSAVRSVDILIVAAAGAGIAATLLPFAGSAGMMLAIYAAHLSIASIGTMVYPTALQAMAPAHVRGRAVAVIGMVQFVASAAAPPATGWLSDRLDPGGNGLLAAICWIAAPSLACCAALFLICRRDFALLAAAVEKPDRPPYPPADGVQPSPY